MSLAKGFGVGLALLVAGGAASGGEKLTPEQQEVKRFIERAYSYDPDSFELGRFSDQKKPYLLNKIPKNRGRYDPSKQCALLREFFDEAIITKDTRPGPVVCDAHFRYPNMGSEDASSETRSIDIPPPKIEKPVVNGNRAKVSVLTEGGFEAGRSLYFLTKTENGWRVTNVMIQTRLPKPTDEREECYYSFAKKPSTEEFKEVASPCRRYLPPADRP